MYHSQVTYDNLQYKNKTYNKLLFESLSDNIIRSSL